MAVASQPRMILIRSSVESTESYSRSFKTFKFNTGFGFGALPRPLESHSYFGSCTYAALKIKLMFIYGSLPRPSDIHYGASYLHENGYNLQSSSGLNCLFDSLLVLWNQALFCYHEEYAFEFGRCCRNCYTEVVSPGYVHSQGEIWLKRISFMVDLICRNGVYISALLRFQCEGGHISSETFALGDAVYGFYVIANAVMALQLRIFLKAEAHCFEEPVILCHAKLHVVMRRTDRSLNSFTVMDQLVVLFIKSLLRLKEETSSFSCWRVSNERYSSPSHATMVLRDHQKLQKLLSSSQVHIGASLIEKVIEDTHIWSFSSPRWNEKLKDGLLSLSQAYGFLIQDTENHSGGLQTIRCLFYGSLPRPPEEHHTSFTSTYSPHIHIKISKFAWSSQAYGVLQVQSPRWNVLPS